MKRFQAILLALSLAPAASFAQGFYARLGAGYALPQGTASLDGGGNPLSGSLTLPSSTNGNMVGYNIERKTSLTAGPQLTVAAGYMFNDHLGVDLSLSQVLFPAKYTLVLDNYYSNGIPYDLGVTTQALTPTFLSPSLVLESGGNKLGAYGRFGIVVPVYTDYQQNDYFTNKPGYGKVSNTVITYQFHNAFGLGLTAAAGLSYKAGPTKLWAEASLLSLSLYAKSKEMTSYSEDGLQYISQIPDSSRFTTFSNNFTASAYSTTQDVSYATPFSNMAFNVGVTFNFGDNSKPKTEEETADKKKKKKTYKSRWRY